MPTIEESMPTIEEFMPTIEESMPTIEEPIPTSEESIPTMEGLIVPKDSHKNLQNNDFMSMFTVQCSSEQSNTFN